MASSGDLESGDAPPSYNSLFPDKLRPNQIGRQLRRGFSFHQTQDYDTLSSETSGIGKGCVSLCTSLGCAVFVLGMCLGIPITMIVIGAINLDACEIEGLIPIWLIVMGVFQLIEGSFRSLYHGSRDDEDKNEASKDPLTCFIFAWFIAGNVWVFSNWNKYTPERMSIANSTLNSTVNSNYCDDLTMKFSFGVIMSSYALVGAILLCMCFCCCFLKSGDD